jgi:hypothetical protein
MWGGMKRVFLHFRRNRSWFLPLESVLAVDLHIGVLPHRKQFLLSQGEMILSIDLILRRMKSLSFMRG